MTSHVEGEQYPHLLREKGFVSFPSLCFLDADGKVTVRMPQRDVASLAAVRARLGELADLRDLAAEGDEDAARKLFLCEVELDMLTAAQIQERRKKFELDEEETSRVEQALVDLEVRAMRAKSRELGTDAVGKRLADIRVRESMSHDIAVCRADEDVARAADAMRKAKVRRLPVVDDAGKLVGILSMNDIARSAAHDASMGRELVQPMASVCAAHPKHATAPTAKAAAAAALASSQRS